jgi:hypothetical protein
MRKRQDRLRVFVEGLWVLFLMLSTASAHSDTPLTWTNGELKGLPKEFQPAGFDFKKRELTLRGKQLRMPGQLRGIFTDEIRKDSLHREKKEAWPPVGLMFSASWYHGPSELPPYLNVHVAPKGMDYRYEILVDMEKVAILKAEIIHQDQDGKGERSFPVDLSERREPAVRETTWDDVVGKWRGQGSTITITKDEIIFDHVWSDENEVWKVGERKANFAKVTLPDGSTDSLVFEKKGDLLLFGTLRGGAGTLARFGSKADLDAQRRHEDVE